MFDERKYTYNLLGKAFEAIIDRSKCMKNEEVNRSKIESIKGMLVLRMCVYTPRLPVGDDHVSEWNK